MTCCPHCGNTIGFVFGTCSQCGFNYLDNSFHSIRVSVSDLDHASLWLVEKHAQRTKKHTTT